MSASLLPAAKIRALRTRFDQCKAQLAALDWISEGSVMANRSPGTWRWTRKVKAKTVSVALSAPQAAAFAKAITQHRQMERLIKEMRALSQQMLLQSILGPTRRPRAKSSET
jgi:hypothetical protein